MRPGLQRTARLAILVAIATTLQVTESLVPKPLPWLRLGLANGVTLLVLVRAGFAEAAGLVAARTFLGGLLLGTLGGPAFVLSVAGGAGALLVMGLALRHFSPPLTLLGASALGSAAHGMGQLGALAALFGLGRGVWVLSPVLLATAVPLGVVTGAVILAVHRRLPPWYIH